MKKTTMFLCLFLLLALSVFAMAQERNRRVSPAFPIGAGEEMLIYTGVEINGDASGFVPGAVNSHTRTSASTISLKLDLPVGTTLKRILGEFVDQSGSVDMTVRLLRVKYDDPSSQVVLRSFDTSGISSASATDFKQVVANPLTHVTLQSYIYAIEIDFPGGTATDELAVGVIKIIYEP